MQKFLLSFFLIALFALYSIHEKDEGAEVNVVAPGNLPKDTQAPTTDMGTSPTETPQPSSARKYREGEYSGSVADAFYGNIQVKAIISSGKISDVTFLQYPNDRSTSIMINQQAMPYLRQEAISIQGSNVDIVSGATDSSIAFRESLRSALTQAQ